MLKVISTPDGKFGIKEVDADGNSVKTLEQGFVSEAEATNFIAKLEAGDAGSEAEKKSTDEDSGEKSSTSTDQSPAPKVLALTSYKVLEAFSAEYEAGESIGLDAESEATKALVEKGVLAAA